MLLLSPFLFQSSARVGSQNPTLAETPAAVQKISRDPDDQPDYLWPTNASRSLASSFAETRSNHFHFGIDIRTQQRVGFPCYAIADGYVSRIKVSPYGYGRALYLQLNDGNMAVYAHLQRFAPSVETVVHAEQMKQKMFAYEKFFEPADLPFKKGEIVAYTGASGVGSAHLHFEIRTSEGYLNPNLVGLTVADTIAPALQKFGIFPLEIDSEINTDYHPWFTRINSTGAQRYTVSQIPQVYGPIGLGVTGFDQVNDSPHQLSFYGLDLMIDGEKQFSARYDYFDYFEEKMIDLDRDYRQRKLNGDAYHHLWKDPSSTVEFYKTEELLDTRHYAPGRHHYEIIVSDFSGNQTRLTGQLDFKEKPLYPPVPPYSRFFGFWGRWSDLNKNSQQPPSVNGKIAVEFFDGYVYFTLPPQPSVTPSALSLLQPYKTRLPLTMVGGRWVGKVPLQPFPAGYWTVELDQDKSAGNNSIPSGAWFIQPIKISGGQAVSSDNRFIAQFEQDVVYRSLYARIETTAAAAEGNFASPIYTIEPDVMPIRGSVVVSITIPQGEAQPEQLGVYGISNHGAWRFLDNDLNKVLGSVTGSSPRLGNFVLRRDRQAPAVTWIAPTQTTSQRRPTFRLSVRDELSGFDDRSIQLLVDGQFVLMEYDPEARTVFGAPDESLKPGNHQVILTLKDFCGNETRIEKTIKITG